MNKSLSLNAHMNVNIDTPAHSIHDPIDIIRHKLYRGPHRKECRPDWKSASVCMPLRDLNQCIKEASGDVRDGAVCRRRNKTKNDQHADFFLKRSDLVPYRGSAFFK